MDSDIHFDVSSTNEMFNDETWHMLMQSSETAQDCYFPISSPIFRDDFSESLDTEEDLTWFRMAQESANQLENSAEDFVDSSFPEFGQPFPDEGKKAAAQQEKPKIGFHKKRPKRGKDFSTPQVLAQLQEEIVQKWAIYCENETVYIYRKGCWRPLSVDGFYQQLRISELNCQGQIDVLTYTEIRSLYRLVLSNPKFFHPDDPCSVFDGKREIINFDDATYYIPTDNFLPQSPNNFCTKKLHLLSKDIIHPKNTGCFDRFVETSLCGDPKLRQLFLEVIGVLLSNILVKACFVLVGCSNSGKSIFVEFAENLIGRQYVHRIGKLEDLSGRWLIGELEGKSLLLCLECENAKISPQSCAVIKTVTGDSTLTGERKNRPFRTFTNSTRILFVSNSMLKPEKADKALDNRFVFVPFPVSIPKEEQDPYLLQGLLEDAGYIVKEALGALRQLIAKNFQFTQPDPSFFEKLNRFDSRYSEVKTPFPAFRSFIASQCYIDPHTHITAHALYEAYSQYATGFGEFPLFSREQFSRQLFHAFPYLSATRKYCKQADGSSKQERCIVGICLKTPEKAEQHDPFSKPLSSPIPP